MLAAGDVDPAAGSRDEPTRLPVEVPIEGSRYKYTKALFLKSIVLSFAPSAAAVWYGCICICLQRHLAAYHIYIYTYLNIYIYTYMYNI